MRDGTHDTVKVRPSKRMPAMSSPDMAVASRTPTATTPSSATASSPAADPIPTTPRRLSAVQEPSPLLPYFGHHPSTFELAGVGVQLAAQLPLTNEEKLAWVTSEVFAAYRQLGVETAELMQDKVAEVVEHALTTWKSLVASVTEAVTAPSTDNSQATRRGIAQLLYCLGVCLRATEESRRVAYVAPDSAAAPFPLLKNSIARP